MKDWTLEQIMRAIAKGERNELGDLWSTHWCENAANELAALRAQRDELAEALRKLIDDMHIRAKFRGDVDPDGTVVLDCGTGVLFAAKAALAKLEVKP